MLFKARWLKEYREGPIVEHPPPYTKTERAADRPRSGMLDFCPEERRRLIDLAIGEAARVLGPARGDFHATDAVRRYPYSNVGICNFGGIHSKVIPRFYYGKPLRSPGDEKLPANLRRMPDYEYRFPKGHGPMATDVDNRIIHTMSPEMTEMSEILWRGFRNSSRYARFSKKAKETHGFNSLSIQPCRGGVSMDRHEDRRRKGRNSMKEGTPVAVVTIGDSRQLSMYRTWVDGKRMVSEEKPSCEYTLVEGSAFVLDPKDEESKCRRNALGERKKDASFLHGVTTKPGRDYLSVAFVFRCIESTALVDTYTDTVVEFGEPKSDKETRTRLERAFQRSLDEEDGSEFQKQADETRDEWRRLMKLKQWIQ